MMIKLLNQERGFTIIEAVVAQVVLIIGALCIWNVYAAKIQFNSESENRAVAASVAQFQMEKIMSTRFRYIVTEYPPGETHFTSESQDKPFWVLDSQGELKQSLPEGRYVISYPDGVDADPLGIMVTVLWSSNIGRELSLNLETRVAMAPGSLVF